MRIVSACVAAALLVAAPAFAQEAAPAATALTVKPGQMIRSSDGRTIGRVNNARSSNGQLVSVSVIYNQHFINVPASTLSMNDKGLVTSLTQKEIARLR
jgi:hypothetical protein